MTPKFPLGDVVATPGAIDLLRVINARPDVFLERHASGDWGDLCEDDKKLNDLAVDPDEPDRVLSSYKFAEGELWMITEWDRSVTTILLPDEY